MCVPIMGSFRIFLRSLLDNVSRLTKQPNRQRGRSLGDPGPGYKNTSIVQEPPPSRLDTPSFALEICSVYPLAKSTPQTDRLIGQCSALLTFTTPYFVA